MHQLLILMQINFQIYALIRIPRDEGAFNVTLTDKMRAGLQTRLLEAIEKEKEAKRKA